MPTYTITIIITTLSTVAREADDDSWVATKFDVKATAIATIVGELVILSRRDSSC